MQKFFKHVHYYGQLVDKDSANTTFSDGNLHVFYLYIGTVRTKNMNIYEVIHLIYRNCSLSTNHFRTHLIRGREIQYTLSPLTNIDKNIFP